MTQATDQQMIVRLDPLSIDGEARNEITHTQEVKRQQFNFSICN
jgi:hypothetical protein